MDPTLRQLLQEIVNLSTELARLRQENDMLRAELNHQEVPQDAAATRVD